jgi:hypothetical protein
MRTVEPTQLQLALRCSILLSQLMLDHTGPDLKLRVCWPVKMLTPVLLATEST